MGKKKKPFIDKKHSVRFHLVHRDQRDPLQADADAPEMVLHAANETDSKEAEQKKFGIFFDDDYDYLQHLKPRGDGVLVMAENPNSSEKASTSKDFSGIQIPTEALPSEFEEEEGMLGKGVLPRGPQPDWDPDIVEALDDGLDLDDPCNMLEDDFVMLANGEGGMSKQYNDYDALSDRDFDSDDLASDDLASDDGSYDEFGHEETKSRFTNYSMTSSVMRRTEGLQLLDEQFEKVMEEYDDDEIGEMGCDDEGMLKKHDQILMEQAIDELAVKHDLSNIKTEHEDQIADKFADNDSGDEHEEFEKHTEPEKEKWDCESIISTYSNIYNHPKLIKEPKPIKLTKRLGIPTDVLKKSSRGERTETNLAKEEDHTGASHTRNKNETKEEKKVRKTAVKEERRNRRSEKKANKIAFKDEQKIQERILASQPIKSTFSM